ncbi:hypothetical protein J7M28_09170, partial [bacterium]|nr:hypothetical protein [bacterium]
MPDGSGDARAPFRDAGPLWGRRAAIVVLSAGLLLYSLTIIRVIDESFPVNADAAWFLMLSRSILSGEGYAEIDKPIPRPHTKFPPALPCILAAAQWIAPDSQFRRNKAVGRNPLSCGQYARQGWRKLRVRSRYRLIDFS